MIKLSRLADYAVAIMGQIAKLPDVSYSSQMLAQLTNLPEPTVAKILIRLRRKNILLSQRGVHGGYGLAKKLEEISLADIIIAIDGPINLTLCTMAEGERCMIEGNCQSRSGWHKVNQAIREILSSFPLSNLLQHSIGAIPSPLHKSQQGVRS